jgi:hypothetical protein
VIEAACPRCRASLGAWPGAVACGRCRAEFPRLGELPCLFTNADAWLATWRRQLATFDAEIGQTLELLASARLRVDLLAATRARLETFVGTTAALRDELHALLDPLLGPVGAVDHDGQDVRPLTHYLDLVYRDWGWDDDGGEVGLALAELDAVAGDAPLGRTLVLGAGAARLPYELVRRGRAQEVFALDVDLALTAAASRLARGETVVVTEAPLEANDLDALARRHELRAPEPVDLHFTLANGLEPPFADGSFDTVVTPWFIDVATADLRALLPAIRRQLVPGGRWLNVGPLVYAHRVPFELRFSAQEVVELARGAGFDVGPPRLGTVPYTLSPLNGRGRLERTLAFAARRDP